MNVLDRAIVFSTERHEGQVRKAGKIPYIVHPLEVVSIVATLTDDVEILAAAVLHDTVEDTKTTPEEIRENFGDRVAKLVASETENKYKNLPPEETWRRRKEETLAVLAETDDVGVKMLWLGDKLSNLRAFRRGCLAEGNAFFARFHQKDPREQYRYYRRVAELLSDLSDTEAYREFLTLIDAVFAGVKQ